MPLIFSSRWRKMSSPSPPTFSSHFKHSAVGTHGIGTVAGRRSPMRRVSLPSALPPPRTPNSLSPKLGFLKEISEFDIDPPFISPAASSSSSADTSPMLLSPSFQRPSSARLYRRNPQHRHSQPNSPGSRKSRILNRQSPTADGRMLATEAEDDGFRWTDVDGFYGRKNSIPLQQLLANDLALLNGANLLGAYDDHDEVKKSNRWMSSNGIDGYANANNDDDNDNMLSVEQQQNEMNIPSDITEDEVEEEEEEEEENGAMAKKMEQKDNTEVKKTKMVMNGTQQQQQLREKVKKRRSVPQQKALRDLPTKRILFRQSKMHSYEGGTKEEVDTEEEQNEEEEEEEDDGEEEVGDGQGEQNGQNLDEEAFGNGTKVKFANKCDGIAFADGTDESSRKIMRKLTVKEKRGRGKAHNQQKQQEQQLRHFSIDAYGHRIVDSGIRTLRSPKSNAIMAAQQTTRNSKNRRATCPEIWLSTAEDSQLARVDCALRLYGLMNCGKKTVAKRLASSLGSESADRDDDLASIDSEEWQKPYRTVGFLLNEREVHMEIIQGSLLPENRRFSPGGELTIFAVVYSVDNRESFIRAAQILFRLFGAREEMKGGSRGRKANGVKKDRMPLILIANKMDLQRKRRVTQNEGKMLAKIYKCPFVEVSAMLSANMDTLWSELLRKLQKLLQTREQQLMLQQRRDSSGDDTAPSSPRHALVGRILERTRRFAKSCEDWIAARIVAI